MIINAKLSNPQAEFLRRDDDPLIIFQAGVGSGKTFTASIYLIANMLKGRRMVAGALTHSALMKTLFSQAYDLAWKWGLNPVINKQDKTLRVGTGITFGYSSEAANDVLGLSNIYGLVLDEASRSNELFYNNLSDRLRGEGIAEPHKRLITSPCNEPSAEWYNELKRKHPEAIIRAPLYSNPFVSKKYIQELEERYGIGSPLYRMQVLGDDVEADFLNAIVRYEDFVSAENSRYSAGVGPKYFGLDLAGSTGRDSTVSTVINETGLIKQNAVQNADTQAQKSMVVDSYSTYDIRAGALDYSGGFGNGVYDSVKHYSNIQITPVMFNETPSKEIYLNIRAEMYMELAQEIRNGFYINIEENKLLVEELRNTLSYIDQKGKLRIAPKEDIKKVLGRSPDRADSLALAVYAKNHYNMRNIKSTVAKLLWG